MMKWMPTSKQHTENENTHNISVNVSRSHFPQCFIEFSSERWSFCSRFVRVENSQKGEYTRYVCVCVCVFPISMNTLTQPFHSSFHIQCRLCRWLFFVCVQLSVYQNEHVGKLFYSKLTIQRVSERIKYFKWMTSSPSHRFMSDSDGCKSIWCTEDMEKKTRPREPHSVSIYLGWCNLHYTLPRFKLYYH